MESLERETPAREWRRQARLSFCFAFIMFGFGAAGIPAAVAWFPFNAISLTLGNKPEEATTTFSLQFIALAALGGAAIVFCFGLARFFFLRGNSLLDMIPRWVDIEYHSNRLEPAQQEERLRLVEQGPRKEFEAERSRQLLLFPNRRSEGPPSASDRGANSA